MKQKTEGSRVTLKRTATSTTHFQRRRVVDNSVSDSPRSRTQPLAFSHSGNLGNERPAFAFTCTFYYHAYTRMVSRDRRFTRYLGTKFHTSHTANSTLQFQMNWLLNVNAL